jgi:ComF family protein
MQSLFSTGGEASSALLRARFQPRNWPRVGVLAKTFLFPSVCPVTGQPLGLGAGFSGGGWNGLRFLAQPCCLACGYPFPQEEGHGPLCASCAAPSAYKDAVCGPRRLDSFRAGVVYDDVSAKLILSLKYGDRHDMAPLLGALLHQGMRQMTLPEDSVLVPVPLHPSRLRARRFNQAQLLAEALSSRSGLAVRTDLLKRVRPTSQQKGKGRLARFRNLGGAFAANPATKGRPLVLVDDVMTSGATLLACARALRKAGAPYVAGVTVARALPNLHVPDVDLPEL